MSATEQKARIIQKTIRVRDIPEAWDARLLGEPDAAVRVTIAPIGARPSRPLASYIAAGKGVYRSVDEADARIRQERDAWEK